MDAPAPEVLPLMPVNTLHFSLASDGSRQQANYKLLNCTVCGKEERYEPGFSGKALCGTCQWEPRLMAKQDRDAAKSRRTAHY